MKKSKFSQNMRGKKRHLLTMLLLCMFFFMGSTQVEAQSKIDVTQLQTMVTQYQNDIQTIAPGVKKTYYVSLINYYNEIITDVQGGMSIKKAYASNESIKPTRTNPNPANISGTGYSGSMGLE